MFSKPTISTRWYPEQGTDMTRAFWRYCASRNKKGSRTTQMILVKIKQLLYWTRAKPVLEMKWPNGWIRKKKIAHTLGKRTRRSAATSGLATAPVAWLPASRTSSGGRKVNASFSASSPRSLMKPRAASGVACCCGTLLTSFATASAAWAAARRAAALGRASSTSLESLRSME